MTWRIGDKIDGSFQDEAYAPRQLEPNGYCLNCTDPYNEIDLVNQHCFDCRFILSRRLGTRIVIRGWEGY